MEKVLFYGTSKICWCKPSSKYDCGLIEHFKTEISELFISGILFSNEIFSCDYGHKCIINLTFKTFVNITTSQNKFNYGSSLIIKKVSC